MAIPIGKRCLYTLFAGIHPSRTLPIMLDVGTNNEELRKHPLYIGWRHERMNDDDYYEFVDKVIVSLKKNFPHLLLQWEDFGKNHARPLLKLYQEEILSFNDDIQGTAAVSLSGLLAAIKGAKYELEDLRIVVYGGGSAGQGIARNLVYVLMKNGMEEEEAFARIHMLDVHGLIHEGMNLIDEGHKTFALSEAEVESWDTSEGKITLLETVRQVKPNVLIGGGGDCKRSFFSRGRKGNGLSCENTDHFPFIQSNLSF